MVSDISRRGVLQGAVTLGTLGYGGQVHAEDARHVAIAVQRDHQGSKSMTPYIGAPTSRVDGRAKVTGAAKYAAEFNAPGLAHGSV
jgi:xanthine dehydrogenase YagR molybdenum-binding subunit